MNNIKLNYIHIEKVRLLYQQGFIPIVLSALSAPLLVALIWHSANRNHLMIWAAIAIGLALLRASLIFGYNKINPPVEKMWQWEAAYSISLILVYLSWSVGLVCFLPENNLSEVFILCLFATGLTIVAIAWYNQIRYLQMAIITIALVPMIVCLFMIGNNQTSLIAFAGFYVYVSNMLYSLRSEKIVDSNLISAYDLKEAKKSAKSMAKTDMLTDLDNRYSFFEQAEILFEKTKAKQQPISMIVVNIDQFQKVNDDFGHIYGDEALVKLAQFLKENARKSDLVCRFDGQEFAILMPNVTGARALETVNQLKKGLKQATTVQLGDSVFSVTAGFGVADFGGTLEELAKHAAEAMHAAKKQGANQTALFNKTA